MKFTIESTTLLNILENMQGVVDKRNITPILSNVRIHAENGTLVFNATDMDLDVVETVPTQVEVAGATTVPLTMLLETVKRLPKSANVNFILEGEKLNLQSGKFKGSFSCLPVDDFPILNSDELPNNFKINKDDLKHLLDKTRFAVSLDETRYYLNGIYFHTLTQDKKKILKAVATDGHRLAAVEVPCDASINIDEGIIIPKKAVDELSKIIDKNTDTEVTIESSPTKVCFKFNNLILTSKLISGNFPNYNKVIPNNDKIITVNKKHFIDAVNLVSTCSDDKLKAIKLDVNDKQIRITANRETALGEDIIDLEEAIEPVIACFNAKYISDICQLITTDKVVIQLASDSKPALIKKHGEDDEIFVVMPMRL